MYPLFLKSNKVTEEYEARSYEICRRQVTLAGYRLANLIIDIYEGNAKILEKKERYKSLKRIVDGKARIEEL